MSTINIAKQIEEMKGLLTSFREDESFDTNTRIVREVLDSLATASIIEKEIDGIIRKAEQRTGKNKRGKK